MESILALWIAMPWWNKILDIALILSSLYIIGNGLIRFIKKVKKTGEGTVTFGTKNLGLSIEGDEVSKEALSPMERKLFNMIEDQNKIRDKETSDLKRKIAELETEVNGLRQQIQKREQEDDLKKKLLVPFNQHAVFTNMKSYMDRGIELGDKFPVEKKLVTKAFLEKCKFAVFYKRLNEFITELESESDDGERNNLLFRLPDKIIEWIDEYNYKAMEVEIEFDAQTCVIGVPKCFITAFDEWHKPHVDATMRKIDQANTHSFYRTWQMRLIMILDAIDTAMLMTVEDSKKTLATLNGHLEQEIKEKISRCRG